MAGVDAVVHLVAIPRDFNGGADLRLVNTEGTRSVVAAMKEAGVRRLVHMGALGVADDPALHYASSKAKAEALVRDSGSTGRSSSRRSSSARATGSSTSSPASSGSRRGSSRCRATGRPASSRSTSTTSRRSSSASLADPTTIGGSFELGGPRYWTYREITREVASALGKRRAIVPMPVPLIRLVAGTAELVRIPFPVATDQLRQLKLDNIGPLDLIPSRFGFEPRPMEGALGYLRDRQRDQVVAPGRPLDAGPPA